MAAPSSEKRWNLYYIFWYDRQENPLPPELLQLLRTALFPQRE